MFLILKLYNALQQQAIINNYGWNTVLFNLKVLPTIFIKIKKIHLYEKQDSNTKQRQSVHI